MKTVLITAIGGDIGQAIAVIAKEVFPDVSLIGIDIHDQHAGALYVDKCLVAPRATAEGYLTWLDSLVRDHQVDTCIPVSDAELVRIAARGADEVREVRLVMPSASAISVGGDKLETAAFLKSIGCPGPWTKPATRTAPAGA
jgi:carbamoyl-phosphate synthase large subunit